MKLVIAVVQRSDVDPLLEALTASGFPATQINSAGGFLREQNVTLLLGVEDDEVTSVHDIVQTHCHARTRFVNPLMPIAGMGDIPGSLEVEIGGATMFILPVERFEQVGAAPQSNRPKEGSVGS